VQIVLLNLLIAIMGDLYDEIQETATEQYLYSKAKVVLEIESQMRKTPLTHPQWLQVLRRRVDAEDAMSAWSGRVAYVKDHMGRVKQVVETISKQLRETEQDAKADFTALAAKQAQLQAQQTEFTNQVFGMNEKLDALLDHVQGNRPRTFSPFMFAACEN